MRVRGALIVHRSPLPSTAPSDPWRDPHWPYTWCVAGGGGAGPSSSRAAPGSAREIYTDGEMPDLEDNEAQRIRDALLDLCYEHGYDEVSLQELVERAGVEQGAFDRRY